MGNTSCSGNAACSATEEVIESQGVEVRIFDEGGRLISAERFDRHSDVGSLKLKIKKRTGIPVHMQKLSQLVPFSEEQVDITCSLQQPQGSKNIMIRLSTYSGPFAMLTSWKEVELWDLRAEEGIHKFQLGETFTVQCMTVDWEVRRLAVAGAGLQIWDLDTGTRVMFVGDKLFLDTGDGEICCVAIDWQSKKAFTGTTKGCIYRWDLSVNAPPEKLSWSHTRRVLCLDVDWIAQRVLSAGQDSVLQTVDISQGCNAPATSLEGHSGWVQCVSAAWNHRHPSLTTQAHRGLSGSTDRSLRLWDLEEHKELLVLEGHDSIVQCLAVSWENHVALSGDMNGTLMYWDLSSGLCLRDFRASSSISSLTFDFVRKRALTGSPDSRLRLWNTEKGVCMRELPRFANGINRVALDWSGSYSSGTGKVVDWAALDRDLEEDAHLEAHPVREGTARAAWEGLQDEWEESPALMSEKTQLLAFERSAVDYNGL